MAKKYGFTLADHIDLEDYIMIVQDGCVKILSFEDYISVVQLGGFSICEAWLKCVSGIGVFSGETPTDTPPEMNDIFKSIVNRQQDVMITSDDFLNAYYDAEGDSLGKIIIVGGDVSSFKLNGVPVYIGQVITATELLSGLEYDARNQDAGYGQDLFFETYDVNNVIAQ